MAPQVENEQSVRTLVMVTQDKENSSRPSIEAVNNGQVYIQNNRIVFSHFLLRFHSMTRNMSYVDRSAIDNKFNRQKLRPDRTE